MTPIHDERAALASAPGAILWSMRAWVLGLLRDVDMGPRIRSAMAGVDAADAGPGLVGFMETLDVGGIRAIDVETMCNPRLSADERLLLGVFASVAAGRTAEAARVLRGMVGPRSVAPVLERVEDVVAALVEAGHSLRAEAAPFRADAAGAPLAALH